MKVLIDTNVILDALVRRFPYCDPAEKLFLLVAEDKLRAFMTASSVTDIYYLLRKNLHNENQAREILLRLFSLFEIIEVTGNDCEKAMSLPLNDYEDALIATCARRKKLDLIITRNTKDFIESPVKAVEPNDFFAHYL